MVLEMCAVSFWPGAITKDLEERGTSEKVKAVRSTTTGGRLGEQSCWATGHAQIESEV